MTLGLDVTFTLRMIFMFIYRLTVTPDFGCNYRHLPIAIWIWIADGWLLQLLPMVIPLPLANSLLPLRMTSQRLPLRVHFAIARCKLPMAISITFCDLLRVTDYHFEWTIYRWRDGRLSFRLPWRRTTCHFEFPVAGCSLPITTSQGRLSIANYNVSE